MISVVIPLYNKEQHIGTTINTVLSQSFQDFEIVVVDDGSTDESVQRVKEIDDKRIRIISQENAGVAAARNKGIKEAKGEYIAFLDADDEWKEYYLSIQMKLAETYPQCDVFATNYIFSDDKNKLTNTIIRNLPFAGEEGELTNYFQVAACSNPPICSISVMVRTQAIQEIGGFPLGIRSGEDLLTWARLAVRHKIAYSKKVCATYNVPSISPHSRPTRVPQQPDIVGDELSKLYNAHKSITGLKAYVGLWHKMRASIYSRLGMKKHCFMEVVKALRYNPLNVKPIAYFPLAFLHKKA